MTTAEFRAAVAHPATQVVSIAGVPWPVYKLVALILGFAVFGAVAVATASVGAAVLAAAGVATAVWLGFGLRHNPR